MINVGVVQARSNKIMWFDFYKALCLFSWCLLYCCLKRGIWKSRTRTVDADVDKNICSLMSCGCSQHVLPLDLCINLTTMPLMHAVAPSWAASCLYWEERLAKSTQHPHARVLRLLNLLFFFYAVSAAYGAQHLNFSWFCVDWIEWSEISWMQTQN